MLSVILSFFVGAKRLVKRKKFEDFLAGRNEI
ncbi:MAG: hypothetical protein IKN79_11225 [Eubacterium sp.]|nr:hypothetical protein [Eubacterium sp.]